MKQLNLKVGTFTNQSLLNQFNEDLNENFGNNTTTVSQVYTDEITLTATEIVGTAAGDIGHANGATLVAAPASGYALEFLSAVLIYDYATAAYTGGANDLIIAPKAVASAAITGVVTTAQLLGAAGDKVVQLYPLATAAHALSVGDGLSLKGTAYTQPGTAAGVLRVQITYRVHKTGL